MYDKEFYWRDFNKEISIRLNNLLKQLHLTYEKRNDCIYNIKDNINKYIEANINISCIENIDNRNKIYFNKKQELLVGLKLISYIRSYNYIVYEKLDKLDNEIETLAGIKNSPPELYTYIQDELNHEICKTLCKGNNYSFGGQVGYINVFFFQFPSGKINTALNWGETIKLKKKLLENGIALQTKDNPNGRAYKIYCEYDWWVHAQFKKIKGKLPQVDYYNFRFGYTKNKVLNGIHLTAKSPKEQYGRSFENIIDDRSLNSLNKILAVCVNYPNLRLDLYRNNVNNTQRKK